MIFGENHITQHHIFRLKNTEINNIYAIMSLRSFIISLISIFIPIYFYNLGFSIREIFLYYIVMFVGEVFFEYITAQVIAKFGPKHSIALSLPILVLHFWMMWTIPQYQWNIVLVALIGSVTLSLFWQGYHYDFSKAKSKKKAGREISRLYTFLAVLGAVGPFLGGTIAEIFGFKGLFGLATLLLLLSLFPLLTARDVHQKRKFNLKRLKKSKSLIKETIAYGGSSVEAMVSATIWPLFVFLLLGNVEKVGLATSLGLLITVIVTFFIGKLSDKGRRCKYIKIGSFITGITYFVKIFVQNITQVISLNMVTSFAHSVYLSPFVAEYYLHADEESRGEYIFIMELMTDVFKVVFFGIIYSLSFLFEGRELLAASIFVGGFFTFFIALMPESRCEIKNREIKVIKKLQKV